jgi:hypothetical protein
MKTDIGQVPILKSKPFFAISRTPRIYHRKKSSRICKENLTRIERRESNEIDQKVEVLSPNNLSGWESDIRKNQAMIGSPDIKTRSDVRIPFSDGN